MNRAEINERFATMWRKSREDAGKSQEYVAKALGVSKKTVQNWEDGTSCPNQAKGFEWFQVLGLQPMPYYLEMLFDDTKSDDDADVESALISLIHGCTPSERRKLLYIFNGKHGSSSAGIIEMINAHLQMPLKDRLNVAQIIINNYELADANNDLVSQGDIKPDIELLKLSYENARESVKQHKTSYTNTRGNLC